MIRQTCRRKRYAGEQKFSSVLSSNFSWRNRQRSDAVFALIKIQHNQRRDNRFASLTVAAN